MKIAILRDDKHESSAKWELACQKKKIESLTIDLLRADWLSKLLKFNPDFCVGRPPGNISQNKEIYDRKLFFIEKHTGFRVFPGFLETYIYENKASLAAFLATNEIPHPKTFVSSSKNESLGFIKNTRYPFVAKTLIGAAGSGVKIIHNKDEAEGYVKKAFSSGVKRRFGPNRKTGNPKSWFVKAIKSPTYFIKKISEYRARDNDIQKNIVLFQEFVEHKYEWRCVTIGDSYFAYKKLKIGEMASGAKQFEYGAPPLELLNFTKDLCEKFKFNFMAVDLFYSAGEIFVNELQTIFGHKKPYICMVDDKIGRYIFSDSKWIFEEGDFNTNESYDLRLETAIELFKQGN